MNVKDFIGKTLTWEHIEPEYRNDPRYPINIPKAVVESIIREYKYKLKVLLNTGHHHTVMDIPKATVEKLFSAGACQVGAYILTMK